MGDYQNGTNGSTGTNGTLGTVGHPITCKAAVVRVPGEKFKIEQITVQPPGPDQVRIKILHTSICQTDITFSHLPDLAPLFPAIFGHEASGIVESVGDNVTDVGPGDHVLPFPYGQCKEETCRACKNDRSNMCSARPLQLLAPTLFGDDQHHLTDTDGKTINRFLGVSTFSEYVVVYKENVVKINRIASLAKTCVLSCGVATGLGNVRNIAKVKEGSTVAVFGLGTVGLAVVEGCRVAGAARIIGVDINPDKAEKGKTFGLTDFINPKQHKKPIPEVISELNGGMGVDYSFECSGNVKVLADAHMSTQQEWGKTMVVGCPLDINEKFELKTFAFLHGRSMLGSSLGGMRMRDMPNLVDQSLKNEFQLEPFVTHTLPFSKINDAVDLFTSGTSLRCVLNMGS